MTRRQDINKMVWSRKFVLQALYEWQMTKSPISDLERNFADNPDFLRCNNEYFSSVLQGVIKNTEGLDALISPFLDRSIEQLDPVERAILWLSAYEFQNHLEIPYKIIINEGVELAKKFGANQSYRFINGILDKIAKAHRIDYSIDNVV